MGKLLYSENNGTPNDTLAARGYDFFYKGDIDQIYVSMRYNLSLGIDFHLTDKSLYSILS